MGRAAPSASPPVALSTTSVRLVTFTALLGALIGGEVLLGLLGWDRGRFPFGLSPAMIAAILGAGLHRLRGA